MDIQKIGGYRELLPKIQGGIQPSPSVSFTDVLKEEVAKVNMQQQTADESIKSFVAGENVDISDVVVDIQKADVSMRMMVAVKTKVLQAYNELIKMSV